MCAGRNTLTFYAAPEFPVDTSPAQSAAAFFKIASTSIVQAGAAPAQIANASLDEGCWQSHGRPLQPGKVLRTCLQPVHLPLRLCLAHPRVDLMAQRVIAHVHSRTAPRDLESSNLRRTLCLHALPAGEAGIVILQHAPAAFPGPRPLDMVVYASAVHLRGNISVPIPSINDIPEQQFAVPNAR